MFSDEKITRNKTNKAEPQLQESVPQSNPPTVLEGAQIVSAPQPYTTANSQPMKKKYSSRMRQLAPHITAISQTYHYRSGDSPLIQSARTRNNIASQSSRARKKLYMQLLQKQITSLELELHKTNNQIEMVRTQIFNALMHTDEINTKNAEMQSHIIKKLKALVNSYSEEEPLSKRTIETELNICLDSCLYRIGASGSQRKAILDILYKGMINRNLPNIYRYILWSAANKTHLFRKMNKTQKIIQNQSRQLWWNEIKDIGQQVIQDNQAFLSQRGQPLSIKAKEILRCSRQILHQKQQIQNYGHGYDTMLKTFRQILTPVQFAQLFLFVQRSIHKQQLQVFDDTEPKQQRDLNKDDKKLDIQAMAKMTKQNRTRRHPEGKNDASAQPEELFIKEASGRKRQKTIEH